MAQKFILSVLLYCDVAFSVYIFHNTSPAFAIKVPDASTNEPCLHKRIHGYRLATARITNAAGSCRSATGARQLTSYMVNIRFITDETSWKAPVPQGNQKDHHWILRFFTLKSLINSTPTTNTATWITRRKFFPHPLLSR